jgi:small-conductance mechanosensitive channel
VTASLLLDSLHDLWDGFVARLPSIITGLIILAVFYLAARLVRFLAARSLRKLKASEHSSKLISRFAYVGVMTVGGLVSLGVMGINAGALVASMGLVSVGIGFALKDVIENFLAGIILVLQRPFVVGEAVLVGDIEGIVEEVRVRDTIIRMYDGRQAFVPNAGIFRQAIVNNSRHRRRRVEFELSIPYAADVSSAMRAAAEALRGVKGALADPPPLVVLREFMESSVDLKAYFWIDPVEVNLLEAKSQAMEAVKEALAEAGIESPSHVITVRSDG